MAPRAGGLPLILRTWLAGWWRWLLPLALLAAIWWPEWTHYRIDRSDVAAGLPEQGVAPPADAVLDELADIDLAELASLELQPLAVARQVAAGAIDVPGLSGGRIPLRGHPMDHQIGPPTFRLFMANLAPERLLLRAYQQTRDEQWLMLALQRTTELAHFERGQTHDRGFLWNDHAVAGRVSTLVRLWADIRARPAQRQADGPALVSFAQRSGRMLAKPDHFTVRTNHGVMQNLALLQLAAAFPWLPEAPQWRALARERLDLQLGFYVAEDGIVLEHSPGYHAMGTNLLETAQRLYHLNGMVVDERLRRRAEAARRALGNLTRADGTLPPIGNTHIGLRYADPTALPAPSAQEVYPVAGWAIWWGGTPTDRRSQLMTTWALHDGHGHKHADEGALVWWTDGQEWLSAMGYWPYGDSQVRQAWGWRSANAPHLPDEPARSARKAELLGSGTAGSLRMLDILRETPSGASLRRQVIQLDEGTLLVLDFHAGAPQGTQTLWTLGPDIRLQATVDDSRNYVAQTSRLADGLHMTVHVATSDRIQTRVLRASREPFGGWITTGREPRPTDALEVSAIGTSGLTVSLFQLARAGSPLKLAEVPPGLDPQRWQLGLQSTDGSRTLARDGSRVTLDVTGTPQTLHLQPPSPDVAAARQALRDAYTQAVRSFPPWRDLWRYRVEVSQYVVALALAIELTLLLACFVARDLVDRRHMTVHVALVAGWSALTAWVLLVHLQA